MFPETHRLKHDCGTSETVNPGAEFADPVDGIFVIEETVLPVQFSFRTAGKIAFYLIPDICLVVEANFYVFRLLGEAGGGGPASGGFLHAEKARPGQGRRPHRG